MRNIRRVGGMGMRWFRVPAAVLLAFGLAGCGSLTKPKQLRLPKMPKVPKISMPSLADVPFVGKNKRKLKPEPQAQGGGPRAEVKAKPSFGGGGAVEFRGFTAAALQDFRLIPEKGADLAVPQNQLYKGVDGFWWKPQRGMWFKIPNHCSVVVMAAPDAVTPSAFTTTTEKGSVGTGLQVLRGRPVEPAFYPDAGKTAHPTDYPFPIDQPKPEPSAPGTDPEAFLAP